MRSSSTWRERFGCGARALGLAGLLLLPACTTAIAQRPVTERDTIDSVMGGGAAAASTAHADSIPAAAPDSAAASTPVVMHFRSRSDSVLWASTRRRAARANGLRVIVSIFERQVLVLAGDDTVRVAPAAVASGLTLAYAGRSWTFRTPRGRHRVLRKETDPVWTPPDWAYAEVARANGLRLARLPARGSIKLHDGRRLTVRNGLAGVLVPGEGFAPLPADEHIVFDNTLFVPPFGTRNRRVQGELGSYALNLGDGYMIHGTPDKASIGRAATHGCIRLHDEDIAWLYEHVPVGTPVYIY